MICSHEASPPTPKSTLPSLSPPHPHRGTPPGVLPDWVLFCSSHSWERACGGSSLLLSHGSRALWPLYGEDRPSSLAGQQPQVCDFPGKGTAKMFSTGLF